MNPDTAPRTVNILITPKQRMYLQARSRGRIFLGGIGSGKTRILCYWAIRKALEGKRGGIVSFSMGYMRRVVIPTMLECLAAYGMEYPEWELRLGELKFVIFGVEILMLSADEPNRLRGLNLNWFGIDEAREFKTVEVFEILIGRIRVGEDAEWAICSTTKGRNWFFEIIRKEQLECAFQSGYASNEKLTVVIQATWENTFLPKAYIAELKERYSSKMALQELEGQIVDFSAGVFYESWFEKKDPYWKPATGVRAWDLAGTIKTAADYSVGTLMAKHSQGWYGMVDVVREKSLFPKALIVKTALLDGPGVVIAVEVVGMQVTIYNDLLADPRLANYKIKAVHPKGDKLQRALPLSSRVEQGIIRMCIGTWNTVIIEEFGAFDGLGTFHDDSVDSAAMAWSVINAQTTFSGVDATKEVVALSQEERKDMQRVGAVEIEEFQAYMVRAAWHPTKSMLQIIDEKRSDGVDEICAFLKPCVRKVGCEALDGTQYKSVQQALIKGGISVMTSKLDHVGSVYWLNKMIQSGQIFIPRSTKLYSDLITHEPDQLLPPGIRSLLRVVAEVRSWQAPTTEVERPFHRKKQSKAASDWVG